MPNNNPVFRAEAVEHLLREQGSRGVVKASPPWTWSILFVSTCLILAAALFLAFTDIDVPVRTDGMVRLASGGAQVVAYTRGSPDGLRRGKHVRIQLHGYPHARSGIVEGRIARLEPIAQSTGNGSAHTLMRIDIALNRPSNAPLAAAGLRDGMPVSVLLASHKLRLITLIRDSLR